MSFKFEDDHIHPTFITVQSFKRSTHNWVLPAVLPVYCRYSPHLLNQKLSMATFQKFVKIVLALTATFLASVVTANNEPDCVYNRSDADYEPCANTSGRAHVRNLECPDGSTISTCCKTPFREEVQASRQVLFRLIIAMSNLVYRSCVARVLCEMSCKDGLNGFLNLGRSTYPEVFPGDSLLTKEYVDAHNKGEAWAACGQQQYSRGEDKNGRNRENSCEQYCQPLSPECDGDMRLHFMTRFWYDVTRISHTLGMSQFNRDWAFRTQMREFWIKRAQVGYALRQAFRLALIRMSRNINDYGQWSGEKFNIRQGGVGGGGEGVRQAGMNDDSS